MYLAIKIDILRDLASILRNRLVDCAGYGREEVDSIVENDAVITTYYGVIRRFVVPRPRRVRKARGVSCPAEHQNALDSIEQTIERGDNILPYLSRKLKQVGFGELLLNDWGIHHLHLGETVERDGYVGRTRKLLYVLFDASNAYFIRIMGHDGFAAQILLQTLHDNWPEVIGKARLRNVKGTKMTDLEIMAVRDKHGNCCIEVQDGTAYIALGGGITAAGTNACDTMRSIYLTRWAEEQTEQVLSAMPGVIDRARAANIKGRMFPDVIEFRLRVLDDYDTCWVLDDLRSGYRHPLMSPFR